MHRVPPTPEPQPRRLGSRLHSREAGFSLIEVTLAVAVVAFSFIALLGLLPTGLNVFNQTIDSTNQTRITSDLSSILQSTEYDKLTKPEIKNNLWYFDTDGVMLDTELNPVDRYKDNRVYVARILVDIQRAGSTAYDMPEVGLKALMIMAKLTPTNLTLIKAFENAADVADKEKNPPKQKIRVIPLVVSKTDGKTSAP